MKTRAIDVRQTKSTEAERDDAAAMSLSDLPVITSEEMIGHGFPYDVPTELTEEQGEEVERTMARGAPGWVRKRRKRSKR
jgi:hypothetical protein